MIIHIFRELLLFHSFFCYNIFFFFVSEIWVGLLDRGVYLCMWWLFKRYDDMK